MYAALTTAKHYHGQAYPAANVIKLPGMQPVLTLKCLHDVVCDITPVHIPPVHQVIKLSLQYQESTKLDVANLHNLTARLPNACPSHAPQRGPSLGHILR